MSNALSLSLRGGSAEAAVAHYTHLPNYQEPWLTADKKYMVGCMHPSCECRKNPRNKIQTSGGAYGIATDRQLAEIVINRSIVGTEEALALDATERHTSLLDVHYNCAYWKHRTAIVSEMASPSERTQQTIDRWTNDVYRKNEPFKRVIGELISAAGVQLNTLPQGEQEDDKNLIEFIDSLNPDSKTVFDVEPIVNPVGVYVVSHLVNVVQNQKDRTKDTPNAYVDSLGSLIGLTGTHGDSYSPAMKELMDASAILRSASAREVINRKSTDGLVNIEVRRYGAKGIKFEEIDYQKD